ncbi:MAG: transcription-repair coupling factor [Actinomycetota bacterium]|nr:transcription-repair coupling factor [Actinomycetota bacterium]
MIDNPTLEAYRASAAWAEAVAALRAAGTVTAIPQVRPSMLAALLDGADASWLVVTATSRAAERLASELSAWRAPVELFPAWETLPHERLSPRPETVARRLRTLHRVRTTDEPVLVVAPVRALIQRMVPGSEDTEPVEMRAGAELDLEQSIRWLAENGYRRCDVVTSRGEFAVRGGILDVFSPTEDHPARIELFGDEVESVRSFSVASQRTIEAVQGIVLYPCRELPLSEEVRGRALVASKTHPEHAPDLHKIAEGLAFEGMESLTDVLYERLPILRDLLPSSTKLVVLDPKRTFDRADEMIREVDELAAAGWAAAAEGATAPAGGSYVEVREAVGDHATITAFRGEDPVFEAHPWEMHRSDLVAVTNEVKRLLPLGYRVLVIGESQGSADRLREIFASHELFLPPYDGRTPLAPARGAIAVGPIEEGFVSEALNVAVVGEGDLFGKRRPHREPRASRRRTATLEVEPGDLAVHVTHGVGRYVGMETREIGDSKTDYLVLEYAEGDRLYVPADQLDLVSKYIGGEAPKLHRLGGSEWGRQKARVRKAVRDMADELVKLYAARANAAGFAFAQDQPWQRELEDAFPHVETRDQLSAIDDVKADMERPAPMDRLICGDVGYGKTEIALRAAFKAVIDGKQVAVLVPTTLLAQQHFATFSERFAPFPVRVASLSRFVSPKEQKQILEALASGKVDVVIGTHRLLQKDVVFGDLGLLVVDEEQRFGVAHKEALKKLKTNVDVITMTATPIPRTLEMSLSGIRDLSVVDTPPEDRHPVLTFVGPYDEKTIAGAIRREMLRDGQTFFVHNTVHDIERAAAMAQRLVPDARVGIVHGQMDEKRLERVMLDFWDKNLDVLVTTTIIESGLDIPSANTLIVEGADRLGLAQLYQLRGRVGRSRERAYAYFFFNPERTLTEASHARLSAISQFTELGSGMQIALRDLEIRGAGNLLGGDQHGHIATVGFDYYVRMLAEAVDEAKGHAVMPKMEVKIDLPVDAHLPESWIDKEGLRLEAYRRIAESPTYEALEDARRELQDRFGALPEQAERLLQIASLRLEVGPRAVKSITVAGGKIRLEPMALSESEQVRVRRLFHGSMYKPATATLILPVPADAWKEPAAWLLESVRAILAP